MTTTLMSRLCRNKYSIRHASEQDDADSKDIPETIKGDPVREKTGIRPSLHPITINTIAEALKNRATDDDSAFRKSNNVEPLQVAMAAAAISSVAIAKRQQNSEYDDMEFTSKEEQAIAGRIIGVLARLEDLEQMLVSKVGETSWVSKYNEWASFGVLKGEEDLEIDAINEKVKDDPLFALTRAECLLALFLHTVETPQLEKLQFTVPDNSRIDFLDEDRSEVLIASSSP